MHRNDAEAIGHMAPELFHDPEFVHALIQRIVLLQSAGERRLALRALVQRLLAVDELEAAVSAARLASDLTPGTFVNDVDYWLKGSLLVAIADQLLDQQRGERAVQLLDEAGLGLNELARYDVDDMPREEPWLQLTRRYRRAGAPERAQPVWERAIAWARSLEQSLAIPERQLFQPSDGSRFLARIAEDMERTGQHEQALATAAAIADERYRSEALAWIQAPR